MNQRNLFGDDSPPPTAREVADATDAPSQRRRSRAFATGQAAAEQCQAAAERKGWDAEAAAAFIVRWLEEHGPTPGEVLVNEASKNNPPHDGRAFGAVFLRLSREGVIEKAGYTTRTKGHGTHGGLIWKLKREAA